MISAEYKKDCTAKVGAFVEAITNDTTTTTNKERTHICFSLGPDRQRQGNMKCIDLKLD